LDDTADFAFEYRRRAHYVSGAEVVYLVPTGVEFQFRIDIAQVAVCVWYYKGLVRNGAESSQRAFAYWDSDGLSDVTDYRGRLQFLGFCVYEVYRCSLRVEFGADHIGDISQHVWYLDVSDHVVVEVEQVRFDVTGLGHFGSRYQFVFTVVRSGLLLGRFLCVLRLRRLVCLCSRTWLGMRIPHRSVGILRALFSVPGVGV